MTNSLPHRLLNFFFTWSKHPYGTHHITSQGSIPVFVMGSPLLLSSFHHRCCYPQWALSPSSCSSSSLQTASRWFTSFHAWSGPVRPLQCEGSRSRHRKTPSLSTSPFISLSIEPMLVLGHTYCFGPSITPPLLLWNNAVAAIGRAGNAFPMRKTLKTVVDDR